MALIRLFAMKHHAYREIVRQADAARDRREPLAAAPLYRQALAKGAPTGIRKQLANMLKDSGNYDESFVQYQLCLENEPEDADTFLQLGNLFKLQGNYPKAAAYFTNAAKSPALATTANRELEWLIAQERNTAPELPPTVAISVSERPIEAVMTPDWAGAQRESRALLEELRNSFDALVPFFLNTSSTIGRIGRTLEDLTARLEALEHRGDAQRTEIGQG